MAVVFYIIMLGRMIGDDSYTMHRRTVAVCASLTLLVWAGCDTGSQSKEEQVQRADEVDAPPVGPVQRAKPKTKAERIATAAMEQVGKTTKYDPLYVKLAYPGGDTSIDRGVCTDVVVRALRKVGVDLQVLIHEDMKASFKSYPNLWGLKRPDPNIDHRRVPNIAMFLRRKGKAVPLTKDPSDYRPGDIVVWQLSGGRPHMGIVSNMRVTATKRYRVVHNIGAGAQIQDSLFVFEITGHFRYF